MPKFLTYFLMLGFFALYFSPLSLLSMGTMATTEQQNSLSTNLDQMTKEQIIDVMNQENYAVLKAVESAKPQIAIVIQKVVDSFRSDGRLIYVGAGTSGRLGVLDASECPPTFSTEPEMVQGIIAGGYDALRRSIEGAEDSEEQAKIDLAMLNLHEQDIVIGISANGNAPYVRSALRYAKEQNSKTVLIVCNPRITPDPAIDDFIILPTGAEIITGSTRLKAGTATKLVLNTITTCAMVLLGKVHGNLMVDVKIYNKKLRQRALRIISQLTGVSPEDATTLLEAAHDEVKTAIVMHHKKISYPEAKALLAQVGGHLRNALQSSE